VPLSGITLGGSGANRTVTVKPAANRSGWSTIWIKVSDGKQTAVSSFVVHVVEPVVTISPPQISAIAGCQIQGSVDSGPLAFTISDAQTPASALTLIANSSNRDLAPLSGLVLGGSGSDRTVTVRPAPGRTGWSTIWIKVSDGGLSAVTSFVVNVTAPALRQLDIGGPAIAGTFQTSGDALSIRAGGYDIYGRKDEFSFAHREVQGDAELTVRVASLTKAHDWTKAGLMFRGSTAADASFVAVLVTPAKGIVLQWRGTDGSGSASSLALPGAAPQWLRLLRTADSFFAFTSEDGLTWDFVETVDVDLPDDALGGMALTSHAPLTAATAVFEGFTIE
jgi:hypothetical protein